MSYVSGALHPDPKHLFDSKARWEIPICLSEELAGRAEPLKANMDVGRVTETARGLTRRHPIRSFANKVWKRVGSRESYNRIKPPTNIAAGGHSTFGFVVVQIAGGVNELVANIVVGPAEAIPQLWIIVEKPTAGERWD